MFFDQVLNEKSENDDVIINTGRKTNDVIEFSYFLYRNKFCTIKSGNVE